MQDHSTQERVQVSSYREYPGTCSWPSYAVRCPHCKKMVTDYGDVSEQQPNGSWHYLCIPCGNKAFPQ